MNVLVAGAENGSLADAVRAEGHDVSVAPVGNRPGLEDAGILEADVYLLSEMEQATSIAVAKDLNPDVRVIVYASGSLPDFATRLADVVVDPALLEPATVAAELGEPSP